MMQKKCSGEIEVGGGSHSWFVRCKRPEGHTGGCTDNERWCAHEWHTAPARIAYPTDANGAPL